MRVVSLIFCDFDLECSACVLTFAAQIIPVIERQVTQANKRRRRRDSRLDILAYVPQFRKILSVVMHEPCQLEVTLRSLLQLTDSTGVSSFLAMTKFRSTQTLILI